MCVCVCVPQLVGLRGQLGEFQGAKSAAEAHTQAVQDTLHRERQVRVYTGIPHYQTLPKQVISVGR